jgi:hypothetical protein
MKLTLDDFLSRISVPQSELDAPSLLKHFLVKTTSRSLLVIAHPGHELRVFNWLQQRRSGVFILTDGSGSADEGRMDETELLLRAVSASRVGWLESYADKEVYRLMLEGQAGPFTDLVRELARYIVAHEIEEIVGDMIEGYNPSHDLCRNLINAAVELAALMGHKTGRNLAFALVGNPNPVGKGVQPLEVIRLDDAALEQKCAASMNYSALRHEVELALRSFGKKAFATEAFYDATVLGDEPSTIPPYYESYGEKQVASGRYDRVIRFHTHVKPLVAAIRKELGLPA